MNIDVIKSKMLVKYPFFGSVVCNVDYKACNDVLTAETDGKVIYYNPKFLEELSVAEQTFVFAHEICHIVFNHILRSDGKNSHIWNVATDAVINAFLKRDGLALIEGCIDMDYAINYDAEQLYEILFKEEMEKNHGSIGNNSFQSNSYFNKDDNGKFSGNGNSSKNNGQNDNNSDVGHDTHNMWDEAVRKFKNKDFKDDVFDNREIEKHQKENEMFGERKVFKKNLEKKKIVLEDLKDLLCEESINVKTNDGIIRDVSNLGIKKVMIDWRYILRETIKYDVDWSYNNALIEYGVISANLEEKSFSEAEIVLDTSGSINIELLKNFLRECKNILKNSKLRVGCFDTKFYGFNEIRNEKDIDNMKFIGGGGTDFNVAINSFSRRVENKIIFTDGLSDMPNKSLDVVWIVFGNVIINPKGGRVIYVDNKKLIKNR